MNDSLIFVERRLNVLSPVSKALVCFVLGCASALALPPINAWWILGLSFPILMLIVRTVQVRSAFLFSWVFGFGYFLVALHWIGFAFLVNAADLWMMPFAVGGLAAFLALYWGLAAALTRFICAKGIHVFWVAPICFAVAEYLRGILFSGFPWAVIGLSVDGMGGVDQLAYYIGMNGLTFMIVMWAITPLLFFDGHKRLAAFALILPPLFWIYGDWRLAQNQTQFVAGVNLRILQPNISQDDNWRNAHVREIFDKLLSLSAGPSKNAKPITHIIWPESIVPFLIDESPEGLAEVAKMLGPDKILLTGAVRRSAPSNSADFFTSILMIDGNAKVLGHYDKSHLVPGGEFLPLAWLLEPFGFRQIIAMPEGFRAGSGPESIAIPGAGLVGLQVCYEAIFPAEAVDPKRRPNWLVNVTNDGWFGNSTGPRQHLSQLRLRGIEQGLAIARSANSGISAVFDPFGRPIFQSGMDIADVFDAPLPQSIGPGAYALHGDKVLLALIALFSLAGLCVRKTINFFI